MGPGSSPGRRVEKVFAQHAPSHSRGASRPKFSISFRPRYSEGAGNAGCALHPRSHVRRALKNMHMSIQGSGEHPTSPAQWLYGLWRALPGEQLFCLRSPWEIERLPEALTPAPRRQDHTPLPYASAALVRRNIDVRRIPVPRRDDGRRPSEWDGI